ncbi:ferredoxin domain-containing protein [Thermovenabulum sp.]|uniref:ferredoxin domain-containing protein n=1 Tax=Thermovenabulum sp. TaxID=3100335 RepID=UPI003C7AEF38
MKDALLLAAQLMVVSARTAPKAAGRDFVEIKIIEGEDVKKLAREMHEYGKTTGKANFDRDGKNVEDSEVVILISLKDAKPVGLNCGACGYSECAQLPEFIEGPEFKGPICAWRLMDLGIAMGSAVKTASLLNVDNRIMYRIGVLARKMGLIEGEVVVGIPLSATGKNIYFDRK